ncbi:helix-turn-helix transcriptional regulator [Haloechinothrix halophila]|uniref:helix-turn-helix transcriptional regulator n=1 Tax=Haloechinothrix halophila TaxID=1069073 RepID=UPI00041291A5|nr:LuxR family transcriptional regulator [Haloechinothrix halophila]
MSREDAEEPLIGRHAELDRLRAALAAADAGSARGVLIAGEAGVGKTRLITAVAEEARESDALVLVGRCLDLAEHELPYLAFADALAPLTRDTHPAADAVRGRPALGRVLPQLAVSAAPSSDRLAATLTREVPGRTTPERDIGQLQAFEAVLGLLAELAERRTVVLVIEDLHWADGSTRDLLSFVLSRACGVRLLVLASYRADDVGRGHALRSMLTQLRRVPAVEHLDLHPLDEAHARELVGALATQSIEPSLVARIVSRGEGNPFFLEELLASCVECDGIPDALADLLHARLARLASTTQRVVRIASLADGGASHRALADVAGLDEEELEEALREAVRHNVLVVDGAFHRFRHALLREAVQADLLPGERVRIHAAYARRLVGRTGARQAALLAYHSLESNDLPTALAASLRAASEAQGRGAPSAALRGIEQALRIWDAVPEDQRPSDVDELRLLGRAAFFAGLAGETDRAVSYARSAVELLDGPLGEQVGPERAAAVWRRMALALSMTGAEHESPKAIETAWRFVADAPPSKERAWVLATRAMLQRAFNEFDDAERSALAAIDDARATDVLGAEADALCTLGVLTERKGDVVRARELLRDARDKAVTAGALAAELRAWFALALTHDDETEYAQALAVYDAGMARAAELGLQSSGYGLQLRAHALHLRYITGDWPRELTAIEQGAPSLAAIRLRAAAVNLLVATGRFDEAQASIDELVEHWQWDVGIAREAGAAHAELACWRGEPDVAIAAIERALGWLDQFEPWLLAGVRLAALGIGAAARAAEAARGNGDDAAEADAIAVGERLLGHARDHAERGQTRGATLGKEGAAWLARADAEASWLRGAPEPELWRRAVDAFDYGAVYEQAVCRWRYAAALLRVAAAGQVATGNATGGSDARADPQTEAASQLMAAEAVAERLGARPLLAEVRGLASRARIGRRPRPAPGADGNPLTEREHAVLERVALGSTNRQIGADLYISEKTVSVHLSRAMAKLGASRRAEAVAIAYDRGLLAATENRGPVTEADAAAP